MIQLNKEQTKALRQFFKKVDVDNLGFESLEDGAVKITAVDEAGWTAFITLGSDGRVKTALKKEDEDDLRNAGIIE